MRVTTISGQTPVAAESRLKSILLNRVIERLEYPEKCGETTEKSMEKCGKTPSKRPEKCGISLKNIWKNVKSVLLLWH